MIIKIFLHITEKEQRKRFSKLLLSEDTSWRVTDRDVKHNKQYKQHLEAFDEVIEKTNTLNAPWHVIDASERRNGVLEVFKLVADAMQEALVLKAGTERKNMPIFRTADLNFYPG